MILALQPQSPWAPGLLRREDYVADVKHGTPYSDHGRIVLPVSAKKTTIDLIRLFRVTCLLGCKTRVEMHTALQ